MEALVVEKATRVLEASPKLSLLSSSCRPSLDKSGPHAVEINEGIITRRRSKCNKVGIRLAV